MNAIFVFPELSTSTVPGSQQVPKMSTKYIWQHYWKNVASSCILYAWLVWKFWNSSRSKNDSFDSWAQAFIHNYDKEKKPQDMSKQNALEIELNISKLKTK